MTVCNVLQSASSSASVYFTNGLIEQGGAERGEGSTGGGGGRGWGKWKGQNWAATWNMEPLSAKTLHAVLSNLMLGVFVAIGV